MGPIGQTLLHLRESRGQSRSTIAKAAAISGGSYSDIERGHKEASFILIFRICRYYEISLQEFADIVAPGELEHRELASLRMIEKRAAKEF